ncbi:MAG: YbaN family protein [Sphaerochaetaceae bacterium]|nr:YbaN family protein [Sphaerochaetaceae bacterium]MDC7246870.1 YbaN family protein [Sphaerochaetaceae bacterium]
MKYYLLTAIAFISLALGLIGIVLPVLPTTPFVLLSAGIFSVSSPERARKLENSRIFGSYLRHWRTRQGVPLRVKVRAIIVLWAGLILSMILAQSKIVSIILPIIGISVTLHLVLIKTFKEEQPDEILETETTDSQDITGIS